MGIFFHNVLIENAEVEDAEPTAPPAVTAAEYQQYASYNSAANYGAGAPDMSEARNRLSPPKDHHLPANAWGDSHALSAAFAPLSGGRANGEEGVIEALRSSLREMEAELGPDDANVLEIRKMLREYEEAQRR